MRLLKHHLTSAHGDFLTIMYHGTVSKVPYDAFFKCMNMVDLQKKFHCTAVVFWTCAVVLTW